MFDLPLNERTVLVRLKWIELCNLMIACTFLYFSGESTTKWEKLHDKLEKILDDFDVKLQEKKINELSGLALLETDTLFD